MTDDCSATLKHTHGTSECRLRAGHPGEHRGWCPSCGNGDPDDDLRWDQQHEDWTRA